MLLQADIQASNLGPHGLLTPLDHMSSVIQHSIQAALGPQRCNGPSLVQALRVSGDPLTSSVPIGIGRQADRQRQTQTDRGIDRKIGRQTERQTDMYIQIYTVHHHL